MDVLIRYPTTRAQQGVWFTHRMFPSSPVFNLLRQVKIAGVIDVPTLKKSLQAIVDRHDALRATFLEENGELVQRIVARLPIDCSLTCLSGVSAHEKLSRLETLSREITLAPFDLENGPLVRFRLIQTDLDEHVLLVALHHLVFDGSSWPVFLDALIAAYSGKLLEPLPMQYGEYAVWQQKMLETNSWFQHETYWKKVLGGELPVLELPADHSRPKVQSMRGAVYARVLSNELAALLRSLGKQHGTSLFKILLAAFTVLLHKFTGANDLVVRTTLTGRVRQEITHGIGLFVNTAALRTQINGASSFLDVLGQVQRNLDEAVLHEAYPFEEVIHTVNPSREMNCAPFTNVNFTKIPPFRQRRVGNLVFSEERVFLDAEQLDITVYSQETTEGIRLTSVYSTDLFEKATVIRMLDHFQMLLEGIALNPEQRISELPLLTESETHQLLVTWNDTKADYPKDKCIHELFEEQVEHTPEAVAIVFEDQQLTYRELNNRANQLAHYLRTRGVRPETLVAVCMERSVEMVIGVLGILKAGGAYVPLDSVYPKDRIAYILKDAQASILLTEERLLEDLGFKCIESSADQVGRSESRFSAIESHLTAICLDRDWKEISRESRENLQNQATPANLAYVIYTSGSTGLPKGVMTEHRNAVAFLSWAHSVFTQEELAGVIASTSICFDLSMFELFAPLTSGGRVILLQNALALSDLDPALEPTLINTVPSVMIELLRLKDFPASIRTVNLAGEPLKTSLVQEIHERTSAGRVYDLYGPSETTTYSTYVRRTTGGLQTIGRPIENTQVYILDPHLNPVPIGVAGELHIGGDGLARGYLNRPELTKEKFIANPFSADLVSRVYKTGDLARYLPDGNIEFLGRIDNQVKIRGYRIELGEIDAVLCQYPAVRQAAVLAREDSPGDRRLVAYVVARVDASTNELRSFLQQKLPKFMVPSTFVMLERLPLTPNGKVDRRAFPAPAQSRPELDETFSVPRTPTEELLASIWAEVLKLEKVGIHDNFFDLGGHSLLAMQLISRIRDTFRLELPLRNLFETPTVARFAERVEEGSRKDKDLLVLPILPVPRTGDMPLSFAQERLWFLDQLEPNSSVYNVPIALRLKGPLDIGALEQSLNETVRRHEVLRTTLSIREGQPVQRISPSLSLPLSMIDLSHLSESEREDEARRLTNEEAQRPFDLERGPLARSVLLSLGNEDNIWMLTLHHIASDGWSLGILHRELSALYEAFSNGKRSPLGTLPIQYADFAQWQREWLRGNVLDTQLGYWKKRLENIQTLQLPTDRPRPAVQSDRGARQSIVFSRKLSEALKTLSRQQGVTLFMTLLAAFQTLLYRYTGQEDIAVGSPIAGRNRPEIEGLIGFFVNTLVLRTDMTGAPNFLEVLGRVRESSLEAYAHQDLPFEKLVEELQPTRNRSQNPLFQVMFILQNAPREALEFAGLTMSSVRIDSTRSKFDLTLSIQNEVERLRGSLEYRSDLFNGETIARMLRHFQTLLEGIVTDPNQRVSDLPLLTEPEKHQLLEEWNDTKRDYPSNKCIHQLFEEQVERTPGAVAIVFEDRQFTYRELNDRANQLGHYLRKLGVGPDVVVGMCLERSLEMVIALLGVLKSGAAYLPLDSTYPEARLRYMLNDSGVAVLLTFQALSRRLPEYDGQTVYLDHEWQKVGGESTANLPSEADDENIAYVIYTSGSTGNPKGVAIPHSSICNHMMWMLEAFPLAQDDRVAQRTPLSFDASVWEFFAPLISGAQLVLARPEGYRDAEYLVKFLHYERITILQVGPTLLQMMLQENMAQCGSLRRVFCGGEPLSAELHTRFCRQLNVPLINLYGPTEAAIDATFYECCENDSPGWVPIGRPIANTQIYILDQYLAPVSIGVVGEIHIGGDGLARGYLNQPELTAEKFIYHSFGGEPARRLYRTGDHARYLADGNIEFLGRIDHQIKIRGYRIELGEIEATLAQHPAIRGAIAMVREDHSGDKRLVAYLVARPEQSFDASDVRKYLKQRLPEYMIPSALVLLDELPLTPSGKVDRGSLPAPGSVQRSEFIAPRTPVEEKIAEIWAEVLRVDRVGMDDNFFELGGHSLLATQVVSRMRVVFNYDIPLRSMFEAPTVADSANAITRQQARGVSETEMEQLLKELEEMSSEDAARGYIDQLAKLS